MVEPADNGLVVRVHFQGRIDIPLDEEADAADEQELPAIVDQAIAGLTGDDWASAAEIEGVEVGHLGHNGEITTVTDTTVE